MEISDQLLRQTEQDLIPYYNEKGSLSKDMITKYLVDKKIARLERGYEVVLLLDKNYKTPYQEVMEAISIVERKNFRKKVGQMGVKKETNEIKPEDINF